MYKPTRGGKPSFGGKKFGGKSFGNKGGKYGDRERNTPMLYDAVCAECANKCQVPFRPNGKKPVLCRDCFGGAENGGDKKPFRREARESRPASAAPANAMDTRLLKEINAKLDAILTALHA